MQIWNDVMNAVEHGTEDAMALRQNLSKIRSGLKGGTIQLNPSAEDLKKLGELLYATDGKTRKNTALLLGDLCASQLLPNLYEAYVREEQRFVKSAYLTAMSQMDYRDYVEQFKIQLSQLEEIEQNPENQKHLQEEMRVLSQLILEMEGVKIHTFTGYHEPSNLIIITNSNCIDATSRQIASLEPVSFRAGLKVSTNRLQKILPIRTYHELLFQVKGLGVLQGSPQEVAEKIVSSHLLEFLKKRHEGTVPFYFRVEMKTAMALDEKSAYLKKLAANIEYLSKRQLVNDISHYEIELRLVENKEGNFYTFVKLYTIADERFSYRKEAISTSIKPVDAALLVELAKPYMKEDAKVLDPFCGVGTMLVERQKVVKGNTAYGIDWLEEAITRARLNTKEAGQIIHYIQKDFFDFTHEYLFDEIFTNMPFAMGRTTKENIETLYDNFFQKASEHLEQDGKIIMYTHDKSYAIKVAKANGFKLLQQIPILTKKQTDLLIFQ